MFILAYPISYFLPSNSTWKMMEDISVFLVLLVPTTAKLTTLNLATRASTAWRSNSRNLKKSNVALERNSIVNSHLQCQPLPVVLMFLTSCKLTLATAPKNMVRLLIIENASHTHCVIPTPKPLHVRI